PVSATLDRAQGVDARPPPVPVRRRGAVLHEVDAPTAHAHGVDMAHQIGAESDVVRLELNGLALDVDGDHLSHSLLLDISLSLSLSLSPKKETLRNNPTG